MEIICYQRVKIAIETALLQLYENELIDNKTLAKMQFDATEWFDGKYPQSNSKVLVSFDIEYSVFNVSFIKK